MVDQLGKFMECYLRPLSRTIGREDLETGDIQSKKKMMISPPHRIFEPNIPGGGITFLIGIKKVMVRAFTYVPIPAPFDYMEMGGHKEKIRKLKDVLKEIGRNTKSKTPMRMLHGD